MLRSPAYRREIRDWRRRRAEVARLERLPRFTPARTSLTGDDVELVDPASFLWTYHEIFRDEIYAFGADDAGDGAGLRIVDGGANIGLSVLYLKRRFPRSRIVAFEPDPALFEVLERNVARAALADVELVPKALWSSDGELAFAADGADGGRLGGDEPAVAAGDGAARSTRATFRVPTTRLRPYLEHRVDFLKLDIEGAETEVLSDCRDLLGNVRRAYVEYHSPVGAPQTLHTLLALLAEAGFRVHIAPVAVSRQPFLAREVHAGFDLQLHVFALRD
jgi:FkbM family methyltransferase